jgi:hypothetical protein
MTKTVNVTQKKAAKKTAKKIKESGIKYSDKSIGQPELVPIFEELKKLLKPYEKGTIQVIGDSGGQFILSSKKKVEIEGRKRDEIYFAGLLVQKGYVGFYYMPVYTQPEMKKIFKPELLKLLKGKSCFHIKKLDNELKTQIKDALAAGYECYKERGWA